MQISGEPMPNFSPCTLTLSSNLNLHYLNIYTCVNSIHVLKRSVSMKQVSLGADTEAKTSILTGSNFDQYCTD